MNKHASRRSAHDFYQGSFANLQGSAECFPFRKLFIDQGLLMAGDVIRLDGPRECAVAINILKAGMGLK